MKRIFVVLMMVFSLLSCVKNTESAKNDSGVNIPALSVESDFMKSKVMLELQAYNDSLLNFNQGTRLSVDGRKAFIAAADVVGLINGSSDGSSIGFWAGWALGNPAAGKVIGAIVGGLLVGAAYSCIAGAGTRVTENMCAEQMYDRIVSAVISSGQLVGIKIQSDDTLSFDLVRIQPSLPVAIPNDNTNAEYIGQAHNAIVKEVMANPIPLTKSAIEQTNNIDKRVLEILFSDEIKEIFIENYNHCIANIGDSSTESLMQLDRTGKNGIIVDQYLKLHEAYVADTDDSVEITNRYIKIVNSSDELTDDEKQIVTSAFTLASYSTDLWTNMSE